MLNANLAFKLLGKMPINIKLLHENDIDVKNYGDLILFKSSVFDPQNDNKSLNSFYHLGTN